MLSHRFNVATQVQNLEMTHAFDANLRLWSDCYRSNFFTKYQFAALRPLGIRSMTELLFSLVVENAEKEPIRRVIGRNISVKPFSHILRRLSLLQAFVSFAMPKPQFHELHNHHYSVFLSVKEQQVRLSDSTLEPHFPVYTY